MRFKEGVLVANFDEFAIAGAAFVGHARQMRIALLAVFADHSGVVVGVLLQEPLRVVVGIDVDLGESVVRRWFNLDRN